MAKDDYHAIVYQILSYLYKQLKAGEDIEAARLTPEGLFSINDKYWKYIMLNLYKEGFIRGIYAKEHEYNDGSAAIDIDLLEKCQITPKGIEYLTDNSFMKKAHTFFKGAKEIVPFI